MIILAPSPTPRQAPAAGDEFDHLFCCCSPSISLCGVDLAGDPMCPDDCAHDTCERCDPLVEVPCILCGYGVTGPCFCGRC